MCNYKSFILMKSGEILHHDLLQSHQDLISFFNINDTSELSSRNFLKGEFIPKKQDGGKFHYENPETYELIVDENTTPEWFEEIKESTTDRLKNIIQSYVVKDADLIIGRFAIITGTVKKVICSDVVI